jgi:hypothetical protein
VTTRSIDSSGNWRGTFHTVYRLEFESVWAIRSLGFGVKGQGRPKPSLIRADANVGRMSQRASIIVRLAAKSLRDPSANSPPSSRRAGHHFSRAAAEHFPVARRALLRCAAAFGTQS